MAEQTTSAFREVNLSDGKCNVSLYVCAEEEKKIDEDPDYASELFKAALEGRLPSAGDDDSDLGNISESESNETLDKRKPNKRDLDLGNISESESNETLDKRKPNKRGYWSSAATWTLIRSIKKNSHLLSKNPENRTELFEKARKELQEDGYRFDTNNIKKKYSNLLKTYARSKERLKNPNKGNMNWEFFYTFDELMSEVDRAKELQDDSPIDLKKPSNKETKSRKTDSMIKDLESESPKSVSSESLSEDSLMKDKEDEKSTKTTKPNFSKGRKRMRKKDETEENGVPDIKSEVMSQTKKKRKKNGVSEEPENGNKKDHIIVSDASEGFNHSATLLFIDCVSKNKNLLKTKQSMEMFSRIRKMMAEEGFTFTEAKLRKKWYNLLVNYRRILERANEIGDLVLSWPYYEPMDNIISDTKALALNNNEEDIDTASNRKSFGKANGMTTRKTSKEVLSLVSSSRTKFDREDNDFQRAFLTEWEEREQRREERDIIKLNLLQKIAKSLETLTRKQDDLIFILKKGK